MKSKKLKNLFTVLALASGIILFNPNSASAAWKHDGQGWWNTEGSSYSIGWRNINNQWYYFGSDGYMKTGWINNNGTWYYLNESGDMKTGWLYNGGLWYYLDNSGAMRTGWINDNGTWYYTNESGAMQTGFLTLNNNTYYLNQSGAMVTGDITIDGVKYTFASSGEKISSSSVSHTNNQTINNTEHSTGSPTSGGGGGGSSSTQNNNTTSFLGYSDLYGNWNIDSYIKDSGMTTTLSGLIINSAIDEKFTVTKEGILTSLGDFLNPTVKESILTNSEFKKKFGTSISRLGISGDKVNCITVSGKDNSGDTKTGYIIVSGNDGVYAIVKGAAFKLTRA